MTDSELSELLNNILVCLRKLGHSANSLWILLNMPSDKNKMYDDVFEMAIDELIEKKYVKVKEKERTPTSSYCITAPGIKFINAGGYDVNDAIDDKNTKSLQDVERDKQIINIIDTYFDDVDFAFDDGYEVLKDFLLNYIKMDVIMSKKDIEFANIDRKKLGWKFNSLFKRFDKRITVEFLKFANTKINRFKGMPFDETKYRNSNLYRAFTTQRL